MADPSPTRSWRSRPSPRGTFLPGRNGGREPEARGGHGQRAHPREGGEGFLRGRGAEVVYLPRYSPDRSPAEGPWAVLKGGLCSRVYMDFEELGQDARRFLRSMAGRRDVLIYSVRRCGEPWTSLLGVTNLGL
ncbi:MAG: hypothetical protein ACP5G6_02200 [Conexivisphaera sp.]